MDNQSKLSQLKRGLMIVAGTLFVVLGVIGMILPVLPTTPFLLLAAYFYARSSQRFYDWLMTNRWFGEYIRNYREGRGIPLRQKIITISLLWLTIGYSALFVVSIWWVRVLLFGIAIGVTTHLVRVKTLREETADGRANNHEIEQGL
jgi:uncharacterized membrane protein YbaN (DUF454 family)